MRSRNIKPGFFKNEDLADLGSYAQLLFIGLWQIADKEGKLEDRPKRIKAEIFPYYDPKPSVETLLNHLSEREFILRYRVKKLKLIKIINFQKHQSPHHTEKSSILPGPCDSPCDNGEHPVNSPLLDGENPPDSLITDSLITDSLITDSLEKDLSKPAVPTAFSVQDLAQIWNEKAPPELSRVNLPLKRQPRDLEKIKDALKRNPEQEWWERVIIKLFNSPHCRGMNDRGWKASFDFMVQRAEVILDGKYDGRQEPEGYGGIRDWLKSQEEGDA